MRLWSIHPKYLDSKGLVAFWRETLLAKKVLAGRTRGYKNHPQLVRFKALSSCSSIINAYLLEIYAESRKRNYNFDRSKIGPIVCKDRIPVTSGQIKYEFQHLLNKLKQRDYSRYLEYKDIDEIEINPVFAGIDGPVEAWEKTG